MAKKSAFVPAHQDNHPLSNGAEPARDGEIVALLAQISQRLLKNEQERAAFRKSLQEYGDSVESLESRSDQSERIFLTLQDKLSKHESAEENLRRRQEQLEMQQKEQMERIQKAAALADKIEEALAQQVRLNRRLDKITQDKARFIRKLERIEETVTETQAALQSKAMVLLTDQSKVEDKRMPAPPLAAKPPENEQIILPRPARNWIPALPQKLATRGAMVLAGLLLFGVVIGLGLAALDSLTAPVEPTKETAAADTTPVPTAPKDSIETAGLQPVPSFEQRAPEAAPPAATPAPPPPPDAPKDAMAMSDAEKVAQFNKDPDALAAAMNNIEPSTPDPATTPMQDVSEPPPLPVAAAIAPPPPAPVPVHAPAAVKPVVHTAPPPPAPPKPVIAAAKPVALPPPPVVEAAAKPPVPAPAPAVETIRDDFDTAAFIKSQALPGALADRIAHDPALPQAAKEIEKQAFNGVPEAQHDLAAIYTAGRDSVPVDYTKAAAWFHESAVLGVSNAQYNLGVLYHQGLGVKQDTTLAMEWYQTAAQQNHPEAEYNLGIAHIEGAGAGYNPHLAADYFRKSARQGVREASYNLGLIYENGLLGVPDTHQAIFWYRTSADQGSPEGRAAMNQLAKSLHLGPPEIDKIYNKIKADEKAAGRDIPVTDIPQQGLAATGTPEKKAEAVPSPPPPPVDTATADNIDQPGPPIPLSDAKPDAPTKDQTVIAQIQEQLVRLGLYPGPADGVDNDATDDAVRAYQKMNSLQQDGRVSQALLINLLSSGLGNPHKADKKIEPGALQASDMAPPAE